MSTEAQKEKRTWRRIVAEAIQPEIDTFQKMAESYALRYVQRLEEKDRYAAVEALSVVAALKRIRDNIPYLPDPD